MPMAARIIKNGIYLAAAAFFIISAFPPLSEASLTPIEISEEKREPPSAGSWFIGLSKYRDHLVKEHGTEFAFLVNYTQQIIVKSSHDKGKSRGVGYLNLEIKQRLWQGAAAFIELEADKGRGLINIFLHFPVLILIQEKTLISIFPSFI